jgi:hypothetical protein
MGIENEQPKSVFWSKTIWVNVVMAVSAFFPMVHEFIIANPDLFAMFWSLVNVVLRLITNQELYVKK